MCGIAGILRFDDSPVNPGQSVAPMVSAISHRGPDSTSFYTESKLALGFARLSILDLAKGNQPYHSADKQITLICNGEIFNHRELRSELKSKGYDFFTTNDIEVLIPLYQEYGVDFLTKLNGQFAVALYDKQKDLLVLGRDHFGICPLYYSIDHEQVLFASEAKGILAVKSKARSLNLRALDHVLCFPSVMAPFSIFQDINTVPPGAVVTIERGRFKVTEYWDLNYPLAETIAPEHNDEYYADAIENLLLESVKMRLKSDVPLTMYLSGGLDSTLIGGLIRKVDHNFPLSSFSFRFHHSQHKPIDETSFQRIAAHALNSDHHEVIFGWEKFYEDFKQTLYHAEVPMKETYNVCSFNLSRAVRAKNYKVVLSGEGADEIFGGYAGYKFDNLSAAEEGDLMEQYQNEEIRKKLWGDPDFAYETSEYQLLDLKRSLYSKGLNECFDQVNCYTHPVINTAKIVGRNAFNQRSYIDFKVRLSSHLLADHGDRMTAAQGVEGRYPFLDVKLVEFMSTVPSHIKVRDLTEKYILKRIAQKFIPRQIVEREKFGFVAPSSQQLLQQNQDWVNDYLSYDKISRDGFFNPEYVEMLRRLSLQQAFDINPSFQNDVLMFVLSFNVFKEIFDIKPF